MARFKAWPIRSLKDMKCPLPEEIKLKPDTEGLTKFPEKKGNRRVAGAKKTEIDGIKFDSGIEAAMYLALKNLKIPHERQHKIILQEGFRCTDGEKIRAIKWIVDFYFPWCETILDTKGYATETAKIKMKIFKYQNLRQDEIPQKYKELIIVKKRKEVEPTALRLLELWQKIISQNNG